jgi:hypothetical protein
MIKVIFRNSRRNIIYEKYVESEVIECTCVVEYLIKFFKIYFDIDVEEYPISDLQINDLKTIDIILNDKDIGKLRELKINEIL